MEQIALGILGTGGGLALLFALGRRAFVKWAQENVQVNAAEAASAVVTIMREQLEEFKKENAELRKEIAELREEIRKLRGL